ncbi:MAG: hypothetical protein JG777_2971 [Clostridia bacterium]|jgi:glycosyltransferase involved in cell wall biosynthesis|nr:hypothetical protein [Clostridia bacterium]
MATYNGEKYIEEQLISIVNQTILPNEVLIFDDQSNDSTVMIIKEFIYSRNLNWEIIVNTSNIGWRKNFIQGLRRASQEFIFLCDQDDIWESDKCEILLNTISKIKDCNLLLSNYYPFSLEKETTIPRTMYNQCNNKKTMEVKLNVKNLVSVYRPGCTYCFRKEFFKSIEKYWIDGIAHDRFIYEFALLFGSVYLLQYRAIQYRRHSNNNSPMNIRTRRARLNGIFQMIKMTEYFLNILSTEPLPKREMSIPVLQQILKFYKDQESFYSYPALSGWIKLAIFHFSDYPRLKNLVGDLIIGLNSKLY